MKSLINLLCIGCVACAFTACSDDDNGNIVDPIEGGQNERIEDAIVQFRVSQSSPGTYAYVGNDDATPAESTINGAVQVYVFDDQGLFEKYASLAVTGAGSPEPDGSYLYYSSDLMRVSSGRKYFYLFANMSSAIVTPSANSYREDFEKRELATAIGTMTANGSFYIGTLEPGTKTILADDNPQTVNLTVGRLAAKVLLSNDKPTVHVRENLAGTFDFDGARYRLVNLAKDYYLVGQSSSSIGTMGNYMESPYFTQSYSALVPALITPPSNPWTTPSADDVVPGKAVYTKENTHSTPMNGTATSVQYKVKYTPNAVKELYDLDGTVGATPEADGTFWTAAVDSNNYFFNQDPKGKGEIKALGGTVDDDTVVEYVCGYSYYTIPITDNTETKPAAKYSVIRNHSYILTLKNLYRLGAGKPDIEEPGKEIDDEYDIEFEIKVLPWFKVVQDVDL